MVNVTIYFIYGDSNKLVTELFDKRLMTCISIEDKKGKYWLRGQAMNKYITIITGISEQHNIDKIESMLHNDEYDAAIIEINQMESRSNLFTDWYYAHR